MRIGDWSSDVCSSDLVGGHQHCAVDDQEVGVAGRQATAVVFDRPGPRQRKQPVGPAVAGPQGGDLVGHRLELGVMRVGRGVAGLEDDRSEEHTSELQSLMRISYAVFCLEKKKTTRHIM